MERKTEINQIVLALKEYWLEHPNATLGQIIGHISHNTINNFDPHFLNDKVLFNYLIENLKESEDNYE